MIHKFVAKNEKGHLTVTPLVASQKLCLSKPQTGANGRPDKRRLMLSEFSSAAYTSCARSYRRSIAALISNVYALRTAKPNWRDDSRAVAKTQARCEVSSCGAAEQLRGFDVIGPLQQRRRARSTLVSYHVLSRMAKKLVEVREQQLLRCVGLWGLGPLVF